VSVAPANITAPHAAPNEKYNKNIPLAFLFTWSEHRHPWGKLIKIFLNLFSA
jgi:hypothetical protein